jgi:hypothetical protein
MTNASHPGDETDATESADRAPDALKQQLFTAWAATHPGGTRQQFEDAWLAMTNDAPPSDGPNGPPAGEDQDPVVIERRMFEEWRASHPDGTRAQFEAEWKTLTSIRGV